MQTTKSSPKTFFLLFLLIFFLSHPLQADPPLEKEQGTETPSFYMPPAIYPLDISETYVVPAVNNNRADLTNLRFMTIDPEGAHELDDALYAEHSEKGGYHIAVAIADPTHFVQANSPIALEAKRRGITIYGDRQSIPMLPPEIAKICSLKEGKKRPAIIVDFHIDKDGNFQNEISIYKALIRSRHQLSYDYVQRIYQGRGRGIVSFHLRTDLSTLRNAAQSLRFYSSGQFENLSSQDVVSEMMMTANNAVAMYLKEMVVQEEITRGLYRTQRTLDERAHYTSTSSYHATLDRIYTHFTSPLRRYADMMVHWLLFEEEYDFSDDTLEHIETQQRALKRARL